jgi:hypothetical protein
VGGLLAAGLIGFPLQRKKTNDKTLDSVGLKVYFDNSEPYNLPLPIKGEGESSYPFEKVFLKRNAISSRPRPGLLVPQLQPGPP